MIFDWAHIPMLVSGVAYARGTATRRHTMIVMQNFIILLCTYVDFKRSQTKFCGIKSVQAPHAYIQAMTPILPTTRVGQKWAPTCVVLYQYIFYLLLNGIIRIAAGSSFQKLEKQVASSYQSKRATIFLIAYLLFQLLFREKTFFNCIAG